MSQPLPLISIVIPAHNEALMIAGAVKSALKQKTTVMYEILVIDNASTDKTAEIAKKLGAHVIHESQKGLYHARRAGLNHAKGEILIYMDADTHLPPGFVEQAYSYLAKHKDVVGTSYAFDFYDGADPLTRLGAFLYREIVTRLVNVGLRVLGKPEMYWGLCMVMRTEPFRKAGGNDMSFPFYGEDTMIAYRLASQGKVRFLYHPHVLTSARRYKNSGGFRYLFLTTGVFLLLHANQYEKAKTFVNRYMKH